MPSLVLGTAGHIDHGKSALVKALTGTDPDRLPEEKERGVTIELGFARLELPSGRTMGVVDVPGHEKFVRQMVAGATGIDVVLLVVAADDGVMPQTREHLAIIDLLGIARGRGRAHQVRPRRRGLARARARRHRAAARGHQSSRARRSSRSARRPAPGLPELLATLDALAGETQGAPGQPPDAAAGRPRVHDRRRGHRRDRHDVVGQRDARRRGRDLSRAAIAGRVRGVQVHGAAGREGAGRSARRDQPRRCRARRDRARRRRRDARHAHRHRPLRRALHLPRHAGRRQAVRVRRARARQPRHARGARPRAAHGRRAAAPRASRRLAQVRLEEPLAPRYDDRFIVRSYSPVYTIGGGVVLDALPPRRTRLGDARARAARGAARARPVERIGRAARLARRCR